MVEIPIVQCAIDDGRRVPLPFKHLRVYTLPTSSAGHSCYGWLLLDVWNRYQDVPGLLWLEADVAVDPTHLEEIRLLLEQDDDQVIAVPYLLYPSSTHLSRPVWPFYVYDDHGERRILSGRDVPPRHPLSFGLGCTYLPARLLEFARPYLHDWDYPVLDSRLSAVAAAEGVPITTTQTPAIHLNY